MKKFDVQLLENYTLRAILSEENKFPFKDTKDGLVVLSCACYDAQNAEEATQKHLDFYKSINYNLEQTKSNIDAFNNRVNSCSEEELKLINISFISAAKYHDREDEDIILDFGGTTLTISNNCGYVDFYVKDNSISDKSIPLGELLSNRKRFPDIILERIRDLLQSSENIIVDNKEKNVIGINDFVFKDTLASFNSILKSANN